MENKLSALFKLRNYIWGTMRSQQNNFLGEVLTIIDASIADAEQRKGIKDLIKSSTWKDRHLEEHIADVLLEYSNKYSPEQSPKRDDENEAFYGRIVKSGIPKKIEGEPSYF